MINFILTLLFVSIFTSTAAKQSGCGQPPASAIGESTDFNFTMHDPATGDDVLRTYTVNVPGTYDPNK
jgi:hypothetical protein